MIDEAIVAATLALARANIAPDIQELLIDGNPMRNVRPGAMASAIQAALGGELEAVRQFVCDAQWAVSSGEGAKNGCLEQRALRASWLRALAALGITEEQALERGRCLYQRAPDEAGAL